MSVVSIWADLIGVTRIVLPFEAKALPAHVDKAMTASRFASARS